MHSEQIGNDAKGSSDINSAVTNEADDLELAWQVVWCWHFHNTKPTFWVDNTWTYCHLYFGCRLWSKPECFIQKKTILLCLKNVSAMDYFLPCWTLSFRNEPNSLLSPRTPQNTIETDYSSYRGCTMFLVTTRLFLLPPSHIKICFYHNALKVI